MKIELLPLPPHSEDADYMHMVYIICQAIAPDIGVAKLGKARTGTAWQGADNAQDAPNPRQ